MPGVVLVVGSYNQDHVWTSDELPAPGATRLGTYASGPGGKGFNQAVAAARAGANVRMITRIGRDTFGEMAQKAWAADGVHPTLAGHALMAKTWRAAVGI